LQGRTRTHRAPPCPTWPASSNSAPNRGWRVALTRPGIFHLCILIAILNTCIVHVLLCKPGAAQSDFAARGQARHCGRRPGSTPAAAGRAKRTRSPSSARRRSAYNYIGSVALSLCTTAHPLYTRFTNIFGAFISEVTRWPRPRSAGRSRPGWRPAAAPPCVCWRSCGPPGSSPTSRTPTSSRTRTGPTSRGPRSHFLAGRSFYWGSSLRLRLRLLL
jgi:hypothetical protein